MPGAVAPPFHRLEERNNGQPTDICLRLMEGADIYQTAENCRTSVEMIESVYALRIPLCGTLMRGRPVAVLVR
jgi:hypothetical protein